MDLDSRNELVRLQALIEHHTSLLNGHIRDSTLVTSDLEEELEHVFTMPRDGCYSELAIMRFDSAIRSMIHTFRRLSEHLRQYYLVVRHLANLKEEIIRRSS